MMALETAEAFDKSAELATETYCGNFTCIEMLGAMTAAALDNGPLADAKNATDDFLADQESKDLAETTIEDAENAFDSDLSVFEAALDADSTNQYENTVNEEMKDFEGDSWFDQAAEAFWRGFTG